jgi:uncharacterized phage protein (TIGR02220 family)
MMPAHHRRAYPMQEGNLEGWIKLHRKLIANGWLRNHNVLVFWIYCLLKATHEPMKAIVGFQEVNLQPGQFIFGRRKAAKETGLTEREIRTCLAFLSKAQNMTIKTTHHFSIISIVNWDTYQNSKSDNDPPNDPRSTHGRPHTRTKEHKKDIYSQDSLEVLSYLNQKTGRRYRDASNIEARLKDGGTVEECKAIVDKKSKDKYFIENPQYLNPITLFRKSHWDRYLNEPGEKKATW